MPYVIFGTYLYLKSTCCSSEIQIQPSAPHFYLLHLATLPSAVTPMPGAGLSSSSAPPGAHLEPGVPRLCPRRASRRVPRHQPPSWAPLRTRPHCPPGPPAEDQGMSEAHCVSPSLYPRPPIQLPPKYPPGPWPRAGPKAPCCCGWSCRGTSTGGREGTPKARRGPERFATAGALVALRFPKRELRPQGCQRGPWVGGRRPAGGLPGSRSRPWGTRAPLSPRLSVLQLPEGLLRVSEAA